MEIQTCPTSDDTDASEASETKRTLEIDPRRCTAHQETRTYTSALERAGRRSDHITRFQIDPQGERNGHVDETIASGGRNCSGAPKNKSCREASRAIGTARAMVMALDTRCGDSKRAETTCGEFCYLIHPSASCHPVFTDRYTDRRVSKIWIQYEAVGIVFL